MTSLGESLNKDRSIIRTLEQIESELGVNKFIIVDHWDADVCAVEISDHKQQLLIYFSTWKKEKGHYYAEIERRNPSKNLPFEVIQTHETITLKELIALCKLNFS